MKKIIFIFSMLSVFIFPQGNPVAGKEYQLTYNPSETKIFTSPESLTAVYSINNWSLEGLVFETDSTLNRRIIKSDSGITHQSIKLKKQDNNWTASIQIPPDAKVLYYYITDGSSTDFNNDKTFYKYVYNQSGRPVRDAHFTRFDLLKKSKASLEEQLKEAEAEIELYPEYFIAQGAYWRLQFETSSTADSMMEKRKLFENSFSLLKNQFPSNDTLMTIEGIVYTRYYDAISRLIGSKYMPEMRNASNKYMEIFAGIPEERRFPDYLNAKYKKDLEMKKEFEKKAAERNKSALLGTAAPPFDFVLIDGQKGNLSELRGKFVLLDFWGTWCMPCVAEIPNLLKAYNNFKDKGFEIISISSDRFARQLNEKELLAFTSENGMIWRQVLDNDLKDIHTLYKIDHWPTLLLLDKNGIVIESEGKLRGETLEQTLSTYLK